MELTIEKAKSFSMDVRERVDRVVEEAVDIYMNKLKNGVIEEGLEATFQLYLSNILSSLLSLNTFGANERFQVLLEKNIPIDIGGNIEKKNYVDIVIKYDDGKAEQQFLIELKFKKIEQGAENEGVIASFIDMHNLSYLKKDRSYIKGCYFVFLTDKKTYLSVPKVGTRLELPMYNQAEIKANTQYKPSTPAAERIIKYHSQGFKFYEDHLIKYKEIEKEESNKKYWYFVEKF